VDAEVRALILGLMVYSFTTTGRSCPNVPRKGYLRARVSDMYSVINTGRESALRGPSCGANESRSISKKL